jgi:hypothetical protein
MSRNRNYSRVLVLDSAERLPNSRSNNPRWRLHFRDSDGDFITARTETDAAVSYDIDNLLNTRLRDQSQPVRVEFTPAGHVVYIKPLRTVRYRVTSVDTGSNVTAYKVTWRDFDGTRRQLRVRPDVTVSISQKREAAVAEAAGVALSRVNPTDDEHVFTVDF